MDIAASSKLTAGQLIDTSQTAPTTQQTDASFAQLLQQLMTLLMEEESLQAATAAAAPDTMTTSAMEPFGSSATDTTNMSALLSLLPNFASTVPGTSVSSATGSPTRVEPTSAQTEAPADIETYVQAASEKYNVPTSLLNAVIQQESNFNPNAVSDKGAIGLMQLMPSTATALGVSNPLDPAQNIDGGAKYLHQLLDEFNGSVPLALAAYNAGPAAVKAYGGVPPYSETQNYVSSILQHMGESAATSL